MDDAARRPDRVALGGAIQWLNPCRRVWAHRGNTRLQPRTGSIAATGAVAHRSDTERVRPASSIAILPSRASQPIACITVSRGAATCLTNLAKDIGPFFFNACQTRPAVSPIWAVDEPLAATMVWPLFGELIARQSCPEYTEFDGMA